MSGNKRNRSTNYSLQEKKILIELVLKYAKTVENKKTDSCSWKEKEAAWQKICHEFNSLALSNRNWQSLKICWENLKKNNRKAVGDEKVERFKTGGGPAKKIKISEEDSQLNESVQKILSVTLDGMVNEFDSDFEFNRGSSAGTPVEVEYIFTEGTEEIVGVPVTDVATTNDWSDWNPQLLKLPVSKELVYKASAPNTPATDIAIGNPFETSDPEALMLKTPDNRCNGLKSKSRRRPEIKKTLQEEFWLKKIEYLKNAEKRLEDEEKRKVEEEKRRIEEEKRKVEAHRLLMEEAKLRIFLLKKQLE